MTDSNLLDEIEALKAANLRLREQRDAANAMLDCLVQELINSNEGSTNES